MIENKFLARRRVESGSSYSIHNYVVWNIKPKSMQTLYSHVSCAVTRIAYSVMLFKNCYWDILASYR